MYVYVIKRITSDLPFQIPVILNLATPDFREAGTLGGFIGAKFR